MRVAICICTFRRPELLRNLLGGIARLTFYKLETPEIQIVVVDNDGCASGREVCSTISVRWPVQYVVEPRRGITHARNRAILQAGPVDFIAFIDDDEMPSERWLDELLWMQAEVDADVVSGPVFPSYAPEVPAWVKNGEFFSPRISATGSVRKACASNNVLIASHVFQQVPGFNDAFALSGAEDTDFFLRVREAGFKIVWSQEAAVFESVSAQRATISWILHREYQTGNGWVFCEAGLDRRLCIRVIRLFKACAHVALGSARAIWGFILLDRVVIVRNLQRVSLGVGMLAGLVGHRFLAYQNPETQQVPQPELHNKAARTSS